MNIRLSSPQESGVPLLSRDFQENRGSTKKCTSLPRAGKHRALPLWKQKKSDWRPMPHSGHKASFQEAGLVGSDFFGSRRGLFASEWLVLRHPIMPSEHPYSMSRVRVRRSLLPSCGYHVVSCFRFPMF